MRAYFFASVNHSGVSAITVDATGQNLPLDFTPWRAPGHGYPLCLEDGKDLVAATIAQQGYYLLQAFQTKR